MELSTFFQFDYLAPSFVLLGIMMILTASYNFINGHAGLFSLGHAGFMGVGAYASAAVIVYGLHAMPVAVQVPVGLAAGTLAGALFGIGVGVPCLRLRGDYLAIATLGFAMMFESVIKIIPQLGKADGFPVGEIRWPESPIYQYGRTQFVFLLILTWVSVAVTFIILRNLMKSRHGRAVLSIREDELAGQLVGIDLTRYKVMVFVIGAAFAGYAGGLFAMFRITIEPRDFDLNRTLILLLMIVLGGLGSLSGAAIGTIILFVLERITREIKFSILGATIGELWLVIYALLLVVLMLVRPQGIMGKREIALISPIARLFRRRGRREGGRASRD